MRKIPAELTDYLVKQALFLLIIPFFLIVSFATTGFSASLILTNLLAEALLGLYYLYIVYRIIKERYVLFSGQVVGKEANRSIIIRSEEGSFARIFLSKRETKKYSIGLPISVYALNAYQQEGVKNLRNILTIEISH